MLSSIIFFGVVGLVICLMAIIYDRCRSGHSVEYYRYLENNKVPPPSDKDDRVILYHSLWGVRRK